MLMQYSFMCVGTYVSLRIGIYVCMYVSMNVYIFMIVGWNQPSPLNGNVGRPVLLVLQQHEHSALAQQLEVLFIVHLSAILLKHTVHFTVIQYNIQITIGYLIMPLSNLTLPENAIYSKYHMGK